MSDDKMLPAQSFARRDRLINAKAGPAVFYAARRSTTVKAFGLVIAKPPTRISARI